MTLTALFPICRTSNSTLPLAVTTAGGSSGRKVVSCSASSSSSSQGGGKHSRVAFLNRAGLAAAATFAAVTATPMVAHAEEDVKVGEEVTTDSGLKYTVTVAGKGAKPSPGNTIKAHYTGEGHRRRRRHAVSSLAADGRIPKSACVVSVSVVHACPTSLFISSDTCRMCSLYVRRLKRQCST